MNQDQKKYQELRDQAEALLSQASNPNIDISPAEARRIIHDLSVLQIELDIQNEELRGAHRLLEEARDRYARLYHQAPVGYLCLDKTAMVLQANDTAAHMLDESTEALLNRPLENWIAETDRPVFRGRYNAFYRNPEGKHFDLRMCKCRGQEFYARLTGRFESDAGLLMRQGHPAESLLLLTISDISEQHQAAEELKRRENLLSKIFEILPVGLWIADAQGNLISGNPAGAAIWGMAPHVGPEEYGIFKAKRLPSGEPVTAEDWALAHTIRDGATITNELLEIHAFDGETRTIVNYTAPVLDEHGALQGAIVVNHDITALKQAEEERRRLDEQIQQTQKLESLGVLAGGIAHDFNNILMAIMGYAELALDGLGPLSPVRENVDEITLAARRAAELCRQMLAYAGRASYSPERVDLRELVEEMTHLLKMSISKKAVLTLRLPRDLPAILVDASQMRQVILNLVVNASEAIGERSGVITISAGTGFCDRDYLQRLDLHEDLTPGAYVFLQVTDTGCGMDNATRKRIFEPFFSTKFTGRGLGMAAVMGIVRAHKGAIKVYSEPGQGSTIKILLPPAEADNREHAPESAVLIDQFTAKGTLLLVDDESSLRNVGEKILRKMGFNVIAAADGREAVEYYQAHHQEIDLVLMDLTMPHMNGDEAFCAMRNINPQARVVLASGYSQEDISLRFAGKGLAGILQKPYTRARLAELLKGLFQDESETATPNPL